MTQSSTAAQNVPDTIAYSYIVDSRASRFTVRAFATGFLSAMGHNPTIAIRDLSGGVNFNPEKAEASALHLVAKASSLSVQDDISDKDRREIERLMHQEVLESAKFPEIRYEASAISVTRLSDMLFSASANGELALHGVTHNQRLDARITLLGSMLRASGEFTLDQTDYNIKLISVAGGVLKVKDELRFAFELVARRQE